MPSYKVVYFDARGGAEVTRMLLAYAGQEFEDVRYDYKVDWPKHKADAPFQQLPYLVVDGHTIPQSQAMAGFVAREFKLNGANNEETTKIDVILATCKDIIEPLANILYMEKDEAKKKELLAEYYAEKSPKYLKGLEAILKVNNGGDGFFVGSGITRADIMFYCVMGMFNNNDALKQYPKLFALIDRIAKNDKIAAYLAKRPKTSF